jgi:hypothetical protein
VVRPCDGSTRFPEPIRRQGFLRFQTLWQVSGKGQTLRLWIRVFPIEVEILFPLIANSVFFQVLPGGFELASEGKFALFPPPVFKPDVVRHRDFTLGRLILGAGKDVFRCVQIFAA